MRCLHLDLAQHQHHLLRARLLPSPHVRLLRSWLILSISPVQSQPVRSLDDDPDLKAAYDDWRSRRSAFQAHVAVGEPDAIRAGWQRDYIAGRDPTGSAGPAFHRTKRVLPKPVR
ncbi:DUF6065 family protein [Methylorubrum aminovorans]